MQSSATQPEAARILLDRRAAIDALTVDLEALGEHPCVEAVSTTIHRGLANPLLSDLCDLRGGEDRLINQSCSEFERFGPSQASNATSPAGIVRILLLQNLDLLWWDDEEDFLTDEAVHSNTQLIDLQIARRKGVVRFGFGIAPQSILGRGRDFVVQRLFPKRQPSGPGLSFTHVRPEMLALLNEVADAVAAKAPAGTPRIWVTSITRSVSYQDHLRALGFSALLPSAHCRGWAADIEVAWFEQYGATDALTSTLLEYLDAGILNVIDEGRAWHICLNPDVVDVYTLN